MMPETFWNSWLAIFIVTGPIFIGAVNFLYKLYLIHYHLDAMLNSLKNSRYSYTWAPILRRQGWIGSTFVVTRIAGMVVMPKTAIKTGDFHPTDIENFSSHLKCLLKIDAALIVLGFTWLIIAGLLSYLK